MIRGRQVYLRGLEREDLAVLHELLNDEEVMEWTRSRPDHTISAEALDKEYAEELKGENATRRTFVIVHNKTRRTVGWATIRWWRPFHTTAEIGVAIGDRRYRGKGIGSEVNGLLTQLAFEQYNMHKVELFTRGENAAAIRSAEKNGYRIEGRVRETVYFNGRYHDGILMGILRDEYEKLKSE
ncbi:MAG TPA: GNAT family protein [Nitrososphaerales archaeon]|nr:GNAT family protein [Nitrososphaerales archaeon]